MVYQFEKRRRKSQRQAKRWLLDALRKHLLPAFVEKGFVVAPLVHGPLDRETVLQLALGRLRRARGPAVDLVQIELAPHGRAAFRIAAGVAPKEGLSTVTGHWAAEDAYVGWLSEYFEMTPTGRGGWFSVRHWPWQTPFQEEYEKLVLRVVDQLPELESALREGGVGPHMRRIIMPPPRLRTPRTAE